MARILHSVVNISVRAASLSTTQNNRHGNGVSLVSSYKKNRIPHFFLILKHNAENGERSVGLLEREKKTKKPTTTAAHGMNSKTCQHSVRFVVISAFQQFTISVSLIYPCTALGFLSNCRSDNSCYPWHMLSKKKKKKNPTRRNVITHNQYIQYAYSLFHLPRLRGWYPPLGSGLNAMTVH